MKKISVLKYGVFLVVGLSLMGAAPGCQKMVNLYNNLVLGGEYFTARLECSSGTWESFTAELSPCNMVVGRICECEFYADGDFRGLFPGCSNVSSCPGDATLILRMDGGEPGLFVECVTSCGVSVSKVSERFEPVEDFDFTFVGEEGEEVFEFFKDK